MQPTPCAVTSDQVAAYREMVEAHAARFSRLPFMQADFDDFVQEGLIAVWKAYEAGEHPSNVVVINRMRDWARIRNRQVSMQSPLDDAEDLAA